MPVKISIIVPIYNAEKYIERCVKSIYEQTFTDYEIILVNDGSTDNSLKICQNLAENDPRIHVVDKENGGAGSARNAGIKVAKGEYLAFPDADDWFDKEMYSDLYELAKSGDFDMVFSGVKYYKQGENDQMIYSRCANVKELKYFTQEDCRKNVMEFFPTSTIFDVPWNKLYKKSVVDDFGVKFTHMKRCQDAMFNIDFFNHVKKVASTDKAYYNYMENTQEGVWRKFPKNYIDINVLYYTHLKELMTEWGVYEGKVKIHYDSSFVIAVYETLGMCDIPTWGLNKKEKKEYVHNVMEREDVQVFLENALVRDDVKCEFEILREKNLSKFFKRFKKEKFKNKLRNNRLLMAMYKAIKRK